MPPPVWLTARWMVTGRLTPARRGDRILVTMRGSGSERVRAPAIDADGRYRAVFGQTREGHVVAQWPGDAERAAAATPAVRVPGGGGA